LVDRWGPRRLIFGGILATATGLILLSTTTSLVTFYGAFALLAIGTSACTMTVLMTAVANWFWSKIGIASGIAVSGFGFSGLIVPIIVRLIAVYEWRITLDILALGMIVVILPLSLCFRSKPEDYGYTPDGQRPDREEHPSNSNSPQAINAEIKGRHALKSDTLWRLALSFMYHALVVNAIITHVMPYLSSIGIGRSVSSLLATGIPLMSILGRVGFGWLGDRFDRKTLAAGSFAIIGLGMICFAYTSMADAWLLIPFLTLFGVGYGGGNVLRPALAREYFGRSNFGTIFGFIIGIGAVGVVVGPTLAGWAYDYWGSYQVIWLLLGGLAILATILVLTIRPVRD
jgi:MFS family permease